jgi:hypothetical protein
MSRIAGESMLELSMHEATDTINAITMNRVLSRDDVHAVPVAVWRVRLMLAVVIMALIVHSAAASQ